MSEAPWYKRLGSGLSRTREQLGGSINVLLKRGPQLDEEFWDGLEEALIRADMGGLAASEMIDRLRKVASREALADAAAVVSRLVDEIATEVATAGTDLFADGPVCVL
ncbi:MAG: signal recognition particle receptor subunit alpha, partial [Coriobacteriia bacterium]|nr:signal recognition particle receptor subunit alpha [Coriobacteriia bacterium]